MVIAPAIGGDIGSGQIDHGTQLDLRVKLKLAALSRSAKQAQVSKKRVDCILATRRVESALCSQCPSQR